MHKNKIKYGTLITAIFLFGLLLLPSITAIHHALANHTSFVCDSDIPTHYHEFELSCEFQDIVPNKDVYPVILSLTWYKYLYTNKIDQLNFHIYTSSQRPYFLLRAPPVAA